MSQHNESLVRKRPYIFGQLYKMLFSLQLRSVITTLAVLLVLMDQGRSLEEALTRLSGAKTVAGRMEAYGAETQPRVVIDYAHTPDALEKALSACRCHCAGKLWVVFGCGGDRDAGRRRGPAIVSNSVCHLVGAYVFVNMFSRIFNCSFLGKFKLIGCKQVIA